LRRTMSGTGVVGRRRGLEVVVVAAVVSEEADLLGLWTIVLLLRWNVHVHCHCSRPGSVLAVLVLGEVEVVLAVQRLQFVPPRLPAPLALSRSPSPSPSLSTKPHNQLGRRAEHRISSRSRNTAPAEPDRRSARFPPPSRASQDVPGSSRVPPGTRDLVRKGMKRGRGRFASGLVAALVGLFRMDRGLTERGAGLRNATWFFLSVSVDKERSVCGCSHAEHTSSAMYGDVDKNQ
jgi:hypothetical protein